MSTSQLFSIWLVQLPPTDRDFSIEILLTISYAIVALCLAMLILLLLGLLLDRSHSY